jgi:hypothetical protein
MVRALALSGLAATSVLVNMSTSNSRYGLDILADWT